MNWSDERYVRLYTRDTPTWALLPWEARAVFVHLLRKVDRAGVIELGRHGARAVAASIAIPLDVVEPALAALAGEGYIEATDDAIVIPNFIEAQEAKQSDAQRQREARARHRDRARQTPRDDSVTSRDGSDTARDETVTRSHTESHHVTPSLAVPSLAVPSLDKPDMPSHNARARARDWPKRAWVQVCKNVAAGARFDELDDDVKAVAKPLWGRLRTMRSGDWALEKEFMARCRGADG